METVKSYTILHLTSVLEGGAGQAVLNMHKEMCNLGYRSYVINRGNECLCPDGKLISLKKKFHWSIVWNKLCRLAFRQVLKFSSIDMRYAPYNLSERFTCHGVSDILSILPNTPDIIFVHWTSDFVNAAFVKEIEECTAAAVVVSLIDQAPLSGGCHYPGSCDAYKYACEDCPMSSSAIIKRAVHRNFLFKTKWANKAMVLVASEADRKMVMESKLYSFHYIIKNFCTVDSDLFCRTDKNEAKHYWKIDNKKKVVLFGCSSLNEPRKGIAVLLRALEHLHRNDIVLLAVGKDISQGIPESFEIIKTGYLAVHDLVKAYQAADVFVCPSLADSGPMMVNQSIMCGTPVVAFPVGVSSDLVIPGKTGYLVQYANPDDLVIGIEKILDLSEEEKQEYSDNCRKLGLKLFASRNSESSVDSLISKIVNLQSK